jgi:glyoxylase I family protein
MSKASPIAILGIDHVVLRVRDMTHMRQFYCDVLTCRLEKIQDAIGLVQLRAGRSLIDLVDVAGKLGQLGGAPPGREARNMDHLCLPVEPFDADKISAHLRANGVTPGEVVSRYGAEGEGPSMYIAEGQQH